MKRRIPKRIYFTERIGAIEALKKQGKPRKHDLEYVLAGEELKGLMRWVDRWIAKTQDKEGLVILGIIKREIDRRVKP